MTTTASGSWPALPLDAWRDTYATLHMWTQIAGKVCLALTPLTNHYWNIAFRVTPTGLLSPTMVSGERVFSIAFDLVEHDVVVRRHDGHTRKLPLRPQTVADFHRAFMALLRESGIDVRIWPMPVEIPDPIRFDQDTQHASYDAAAAGTFHRVLLSIAPVFESFRSRFLGKCSPVHFFWGSFDLAVTRFSGRLAPGRPGADAMTREAYSHEVISHGFWPGSGPVQEAAFYAYAAPAPDGFARIDTRPRAARYSTELSEFILPYEAVRTDRSPAAALLAFMESTYEGGARLAGWPAGLVRAAE
jgi:hypothetical protein